MPALENIKNRLVNKYHQQCQNTEAKMKVHTIEHNDLLQQILYLPPSGPHPAFRASVMDGTTQLQTHNLHNGNSIRNDSTKH